MNSEDSTSEDRFNAKLTTGPSGDMGVQYARTGYLGFIKRTDFTQTDGGLFKLIVHQFPGVECSYHTLQRERDETIANG